MNICTRHTSSVPEILRRDQNKWLQPFKDDVSKLLTTFAIEIREEDEEQTIALFRCLLEYSGGRVDCRQHNFRVDYTTSQNAFLCANFLGIARGSEFGSFDPEEMQGVLLNSALFAGISKSNLPNIVEWSRQMMISVPIGFPDNYMVQYYSKLKLAYANNGSESPSQLLCGFGARQIEQIRFHL